jgi:hypothetical protein
VEVFDNELSTITDTRMQEFRKVAIEAGEQDATTLCAESACFFGCDQRLARASTAEHCKLALMAQEIE